VAGIDEVGRGCLCGPVVAAAVILPANERIPGLDDSKRLSARSREEAFALITERAVACAVGEASSREIDEHDILRATILAMERAVAGLAVRPDALLIDALRLPRLPMHQVPLIKGDSRSASIAAASIVAKVTRDRLMCEYHRRYPGYDLDQNKGYPTAAHRKALRKLGPTPWHRRTFRGVREVLPPDTEQAPEREPSCESAELFRDS
jgi:ribonuclease HII